MSNVIEFTGEYYTRQKKSQDFVDKIALNYVEYMEAEGFDIYDHQFVYDMAWIVKFTEVLVDNQLGLANRLSTLMTNLKSGKSGSKDGVLQTYREKQFYEKPSARRRREKMEGRLRAQRRNKENELPRKPPTKRGSS